LKNDEIRRCAKNNKIALWQIAHEIGVSEPTMTRKLRFELSPEEKTNIMRAIEKLTEEQQ
jgi:hypothetical protein